MEKQIPQFLKDLLIEQYGEEISAKIENGYKAQRPVTLRVNNLKTSLEKAKEKLDEAQIEYETISWYEKALIIKNVREEKIRKLEIYENGEIYLQSLSSMLPPIILEPKAGENIFDKNFSKELVERSVKFQEELLSKALKILKPGGEMVYSTCSILKQENEKVLERVLSKGNAQIEPITVQDIEVLPSKIAETITVCPTENYEGFFVAKIKKLR